MKIKPQITFASMNELYWWIDDVRGFRHISLIHAYRSCKPDAPGIAIYGLILGPLHVRVGIAS